jgi:rubrerythrin
MKNEQVTELLYQALETEKGGIQIYETALKCVVNDELKEEWEEYLEQTRKHEQFVLGMMEKLGLNPETETSGREVVRHIGESLVQAMEMALENAPQREAAQVVACECVVLAETKDHLNWEKIHEVAEKSKGEQREALKAAYEEVEEQEDEHLYHTNDLPGLVPGPHPARAPEASGRREGGHHPTLFSRRGHERRLRARPVRSAPEPRHGERHGSLPRADRRQVPRDVDDDARRGWLRRRHHRRAPDLVDQRCGS